MFEKFRSDFRRHGSRVIEPGTWVMGVYRFGQWKDTLPQPVRWLANKIYRVGFVSTSLTVGCYVPETVEFGENPHLIHAKDVHLHPRVKIGDRVGMMHNVTIATSVDRPGVPVLGNDVFIGTGAVVVGGVTIGDGAHIAPNSLVLKDVPAGATAIGVPARIVRSPKLKAVSES